MASLSGNLATMGPGVPYAIAAKFAYPGPAVIALVGDGAMQMNGINGLITIAKYWKEWSDPRLIILRAQQPRPQSGHVGAAGDGGRPEVRGIAGRAPTSRYARYAEHAGPQGHPGRRARARSRRPGTRRWPPTARWWSRRSPTRTCRRCRRTSRVEQAKAFSSAMLQGRPGRLGHDQAVVQGQGRRAHGTLMELRGATAGSTADWGPAERARSRARTSAHGRRARGLGLRDPDRRARVGRHVRVGFDDARRRRGRARRRARHRLQLRRRAAATLIASKLGGGRSRGATRCSPRRAGLAMRRALRNAGQPGARRHGDLGGGHRALGPEGAAAGPAARRRSAAVPRDACPSTAAAASPRTPTSSCASSSAAGSTPACAR